MKINVLSLGCLLGLVASTGFGQTVYRLAKPGKVLLSENFDQAELPKPFTVGAGEWEIVKVALRAVTRPFARLP